MKPSAYSLLLWSVLFGAGACQRGDHASSASPDYVEIAPSLSNNSITCITEDRNGYIWIGTQRGLNRYNGSDFHRYYRTADSLSLTDNHISTLLSDRQGRLWAGTYTGVCCQTDDGAFHRYPVESSSPYVHQLLELPDGDILLNTGNDLTRFDESDRTFRRMIGYTDAYFGSQCHLDRQGEIWLTNYHFLSRWQPETEELQVFDTNPGTGFAYMHDNGHLWMVRYDGSLRIFDTQTQRYADPLRNPIQQNPLLKGHRITGIFRHREYSVVLVRDDRRLLLFDYRTQELIDDRNPQFPFVKPDNSIITALCFDRSQNTWIGTSDQGFSLDYNYRRRFNKETALCAFFSAKSVVSIAGQSKKTAGGGNLVIGTDHSGFYRYHKADRRIDSLVFIGETKPVEHGQCFFDRNDNLWICSGNRAWHCRLEGTAVRVVHKYTAQNSLYTVAQSADGRMWFGSFGGTIYSLNPGAERLRPLQLRNWTFTMIPQIIPLSSGKILAASFLYGLTLIDPADDSFRNISFFSLTARFTPTALYEDEDRIVWIGTRGDGLLRWDPATDQVERIEGSYCNDIASIAGGSPGTLWIGTLDGLLKYDIRHGSFASYTMADGIGGTQFNPGSVCRSGDGNLLLGGTHGLTVFDPTEKEIKPDIRIFFEELTVDNRIQQPLRSRSLTKAMTNAPEVVMYPGQNNFSISFAALNFAEYPDNHYFYQLEGYNPEWIDTRGSRWINYSKLPPGHYTLRVRLTDKENAETLAEAALPIRIKIALWIHPLMLYFVYPMLLLLVVGYWWRLHRRIERSRTEALHEKRINDMNMSFFSNISHEFRTPLTMIVGPVRMLQQAECPDEQRESLLKIVRRNIDRMLRLVNQLMDFNKLEQDVLRLSVRRGDIISQFDEMCETFAYNARRKEIEFRTAGIEGSMLILFDADKIEKIVSNLMSNALKFAPPQTGCIELSLDTVGGDEVRKSFPVEQNEHIFKHYLKICVSDNGPGIPPEYLQRIFCKYVQVERAGQPNWGTGIGLYFAKRLVELHHGFISADNRPEGGAQFTVVLPMDDEAYSEQERSQSEPAIAVGPPDTPQPEEEHDARPVTEEPEDKRPTVLVVDDDAEVVHFLRTILAPTYRVVVQFNAQAALSYLDTGQPDLILSDVLMPGIDGYAFCRRIRENLPTSHIPVILVTAKSTVEEQVAGLDCGADAYVVKPFDPNYLLALVGSLLRNRETLRNLLVRATPTDEIDKKILSARDQQFLDELYALMEAELSNPELNITQLTEELHISRTKLYYKIKGLTGENPNVFFKAYKLNRAAALLLNGEYTVSEIADMTGFSTQSHFSVSFKKYFGVSPSEYSKTNTAKSKQ